MDARRPTDQSRDLDPKRPNGRGPFRTQAETDDELREVYGWLRQAGRPVLEEGDTVCCYAQSEKAWISDPRMCSGRRS